MSARLKFIEQSSVRSLYFIELFAIFAKSEGNIMQVIVICQNAPLKGVLVAGFMRPLWHY